MRRTTCSHVALAVLALAVLARTATATFCELSNKPVCGEDGIEYTNKCVAQVQGVKIAFEGTCSGEEESSTNGDTPGGSESSEESSPSVQDPGVYIDRALRITRGKVAYDTIKAFGDNGYFFVGKYEPKAGQPSSGLPTVNSLDASGPTGRRLLQRADTIRGASLSRIGYHYVQTRTVVRPVYGGGVPRSPRRMRSLLTQTSSFPYSAVVRLVFTGHGQNKATCTAAFITPSVLITAASCLYNEQQQFFYSFDSYQIFTSSGSKLRANVDTAVVTTNFILGLESFDVGLIALDSSFAGAGNLGYDVACEVPSSNVQLLGYPEDKDGKLFKSTCSIHPDCDSVELDHQCELSAGMVGGPMFSKKDNVVRAVATGESGDPSLNAATALNQLLVDWIGEAVTTF